MSGSRWPLALLAFAALPACAHVLSMSTGELTVNGTQARYQLHMPLYELAHLGPRGDVLLGSIRFSAAGRAASLLSRECHEDAAAGTYVCTAQYSFAEPPTQVDVECDLPSVTVPNHIHMLRAQLDGRRDQAMLDFSFRRASLRFRPTSAFELAFEEFTAGAFRTLGGATELLFLVALVLAARSRRELVALGAMFIAGEAAAVVTTAILAFQPAPRFVEAAAALAIAYMAVEILLLPNAGGRWLVAGALGAFHGLGVHLFLQSSGYRAPLVLTGAALATSVALVPLCLARERAERIANSRRPLQVTAAALLIFGGAWFCLRLVS